MEAVAIVAIVGLTSMGILAILTGAKWVARGKLGGSEGEVGVNAPRRR